MHLMVREGSPDVTLAYLAKHRNMLAVSMFSDGQSTFWRREAKGEHDDVPSTLCTKGKKKC